MQKLRQKDCIRCTYLRIVREENRNMVNFSVTSDNSCATYIHKMLHIQTVLIWILVRFFFLWYHSGSYCYKFKSPVISTGTSLVLASHFRTVRGENFYGVSKDYHIRELNKSHYSTITGRIQILSQEGSFGRGFGIIIRIRMDPYPQNCKKIQIYS